MPPSILVLPDEFLEFLLHEHSHAVLERLDANGLFEEKRVEALRNRMTMLAEEKLKELFWENEYTRGRFDDALKGVASGKESPYQAAARIVESFKKEKQNER